MTRPPSASAAAHAAAPVALRGTAATTEAGRPLPAPRQGEAGPADARPTDARPSDARPTDGGDADPGNGGPGNVPAVAPRPHPSAGGAAPAGAAPPAGTPAARRLDARVLGAAGGALRTYSLVGLLVASMVLYGTWGRTSAVFLSAADLRNIAGSQAVLAVLTVGLLVPMVSRNIDLSVGNIAGLSSIVSAAAYSRFHAPLLVGIVVGIAVGALVGAVNGLLVTLLRIDPFIITLGMASALLGLVDWYTKGLSIVSGIPRSLVRFGGGAVLGIPETVFVLVAAALAVYYLLDHTPYGRNLYAIGANPAAARLVGIRVQRTVLSSFTIAGGCAGLAGVLLLARSGAGNPQVGQGFTLTAIAAAYLGAASFRPGTLNVPGTLVAIYFLAVNITGLTFAGAASWISEVFTGAALVCAVALAALLSGARRRRPRQAHGRAAPSGSGPSAAGIGGAAPSGDATTP